MSQCLFLFISRALMVVHPFIFIPFYEVCSLASRPKLPKFPLLDSLTKNLLRNPERHEAMADAKNQDVNGIKVRNSWPKFVCKVCQGYRSQKVSNHLHVFHLLGGSSIWVGQEVHVPRCRCKELMRCRRTATWRFASESQSSSFDEAWQIDTDLASMVFAYSALVQTDNVKSLCRVLNLESELKWDHLEPWGSFLKEPKTRFLDTTKHGYATLERSKLKRSNIKPWTRNQEKSRREIPSSRKKFNLAEPWLWSHSPRNPDADLEIRKSSSQPALSKIWEEPKPSPKPDNTCRNSKTLWLFHAQEIS